MLTQKTNIINNLHVANETVVIRDIAVTAKKPSFNTASAGEFGPRFSSTEESEQTLDRLYVAIEKVIAMASFEHRAANCVPESQLLLLDKKNHITRVITNEFFFYTQKPITLEQFERLLQKIFNHAKSHPDNLHLVLGSFAVLSPDGCVMNVTPLIECGGNGKINLIVKNHTSFIDPRYENYPNVDVKDYDGNTALLDENRKKISNFSVRIDNKICPFSFDNVIHCRSSGDVSFYSCIDVCLDHNKGVAINKFHQKMNVAADDITKELMPIQCSHVVLSNWTYLEYKNFIGNVTHVDPELSRSACKKDMTYRKMTIGENDFLETGFGPSAQVFVIDPAPCHLFYHSTVAYLRHAIRLGNIDLVKNLLSNIPNINFRYSDGLSPLAVAVQCRNAHMTQILLEHGANPNEQFSSMGSLTILGAAIPSNNIDMLYVLSKHGANHDIPVFLNGPLPAVSYRQQCNSEFPIVSLGKEELYYIELNNAIRAENIERVKELLNRPVVSTIDLNKPYNGFTPLELAVKSNNVEVAKLLMEKGANPNVYAVDGKPLVVQASLNFDYAMQKALFDKGGRFDVPVNKDGPKWSVYCKEIAALHVELRESINIGDIEKIRKLLQNNRVPNGRMEDGSTLLIMAIKAGQEKIVKLLIENGADPNGKNSDGYTPLFFAIITRKQEMIDAVFEGGANIMMPLWPVGPLPSNGFREQFVNDLCNVEKQKLVNYHAELRKAIESQNVDQVKKLLAVKGYINMKYADGFTPLELAVQYNDRSIAAVLIENDANVDAVGIMTPLQLAVKNDNMKLFNLLIENHADVNKWYPNAVSPLTNAIHYNRPRMILALIECGAKNDGGDMLINGLLPIDYYKQIKNQKKNNNSSLVQNSLLNVSTSTPALYDKEVLEALMPARLQSDFMRAVIDNNEKALRDIIEKYPELLEMKPSKTIIELDNKFSSPGFKVKSDLTYAENALLIAQENNQDKITTLLTAISHSSLGKDNFGLKRSHEGEDEAPNKARRIDIQKDDKEISKNISSKSFVDEDVSLPQRKSKM